MCQSACCTPAASTCIPAASSRPPGQSEGSGCRQRRGHGPQKAPAPGAAAVPGGSCTAPAAVQTQRRRMLRMQELCDAPLAATLSCRVRRRACWPHHTPASQPSIKQAAHAPTHLAERQLACLRCDPALGVHAVAPAAHRPRQLQQSIASELDAASLECICCSSRGPLLCPHQAAPYANHTRQAVVPRVLLLATCPGALNRQAAAAAAPAAARHTCSACRG
jgi:hypothetical protein